MQQGTVKDGQVVVGLHVDNVVKVGDGTVIIAQLHTQLTTVIVSDKVVRIQVERHVIIGHGTTQIVVVVTGQGAVHIISRHLGLQMDSLAQELIGVPPFVPRQADVRTCRP